MKSLYLFVEGVDDQRFLERIFLPKLEDNFYYIKITLYAEKATSQNAGYVRALRRLSHNEVFVLADKNRAPCFTQRREQVAERFEQEISHRQIIIVETTIEAWYLAGLSPQNPFKINPPANTESINKQRFEQLIQHLLQRDLTHQQIKINILNYWSWELALTRSRSLRYFAERLGLV